MPCPGATVLHGFVLFSGCHDQESEKNKQQSQNEICMQREAVSGKGCLWFLALKHSDMCIALSSAPLAAANVFHPPHCENVIQEQINDA